MRKVLISKDLLQDLYVNRCGRKVYLLKLLSHLVPYLKHGDKLAKADLVKKNILERNVRFGFV